MSTVAEMLGDHLLGDVTTLCQCWRLSRGDGTVMGFTDTDRRLDFDGTSFEPQTGLAASEARAALGPGAQGVEVEGALDDARITADDIAAGLYDGAEVETWLVNWADPQERALISRAVIGQVTASDGRFIAELKSRHAVLDGVRVRRFHRECDAELGDARCGVNLAAPQFNGQGTVSSLQGPAGFVATGLETFEAGWFEGGTVEWLDGPHAGARMRVSGHDARTEGVVIALESDGAAPVPGAAFKITAGCDKRFATCKAKFANHLNFRGFPHLPGNDVAYGYVSRDLPLDGAPVIP